MNLASHRGDTPALPCSDGARIASALLPHPDSHPVFPPNSSKSSHAFNLGIADILTNSKQTDRLPLVDSCLSILEECKQQKSSRHAMLAYGCICEYGIDTLILLQSHLVSLFIECGCMPDSQKAFHKLRHRSEYTWTCLIQGYVECGEPERTLELFEEMKEDGVLPNKFTFVPVLKACVDLQWINKGQDIHSEIVERGSEIDLFVGSALVDMYGKFGLLGKAQEVFDGLSTRSIVSWTALIAGYAEHGPGEKALDCLDQMHAEGFVPDVGVFVCILKACGLIQDILKGRQLHSEIIKQGFADDSFIANALMDMYAKCSSMAEAEIVFAHLPLPTVVSWTTLIAGYSQCGLSIQALDCYERMQTEGETPNAVTFVCTLKACTDSRDLEKGQRIHASIIREGFEQKLHVHNSLVGFYAKCGYMDAALNISNEAVVHSVISWTALIDGYVELNLIEEALHCFFQMQMEGLSPDVASYNAVLLGFSEKNSPDNFLQIYAYMQEQGLLPNESTFLVVLKACKSKSVLTLGRRIHAQLHSAAGLKASVQLGTVLLEMYSNSGCMDDAHGVFDDMYAWDNVAWTVLTTGYAGQGKSDLVFHLFRGMEREAMKPDKDTFLSILIACTHAGLVDEGKLFFNVMREEFGITPTLEHYNCMIDLLGRAGRLKEAVSMLGESHVTPDHVMWCTILGSCCKWHNIDLARHAFEHVITLDKRYEAAFVLMENILSDVK